MIYCAMVGGVRVGGVWVSAIESYGGHLMFGKEFKLDEGESITDIYDYCEKEYGFTGEEWEKVKSDFDYDDLENFLKSKGIDFDTWDDE